MVFAIKPAEPISGRLLIAIAGPQASGKTVSALLLATGITQVTGGKICLIDTENKRALRYAKDFKFNHMPFDPPFSPLRYLEAIEFAEKSGYSEGDVIIIDSTSHEHEGPGGVLEMHERFLDEKCGNDYAKREKLKFTAWIKPKQDRTRAIQMGLQRSRAHIILCFRAKEKTAMVKVGGKTEVVMDGFQPIGGDEYFFEMDITMILPEGAQGRPDWSAKAARINEYGEGPLKKLLHGTGQISVETGRKLAELNMIEAADPMAALKREASALSAEIKAAATEAELEAIWTGKKAVLDRIKAASASAYAALDKIYAERAQALKLPAEGGATEFLPFCNTCGGGDPECPDCGGKSRIRP